MIEVPEIVVQIMYDHAWEEQGVLDFITEPLLLTEFLAHFGDVELEFHAIPFSRIVGGPYDGGHVICGTGFDRFYFPVMPAQIPLLKASMELEHYADLVRRTPPLHEPEARSMQGLNPEAWERHGVVEPSGRLFTVADWLATFDADYFPAPIAPSRIRGGEYAGGWVLTIDWEGFPAYYALPAAAVPALRGYLLPELYAVMEGATAP